MTKCRKCNGTGYLPNFAHVNNGICWACGGLGDPTASLPQDPEAIAADEACRARTAANLARLEALRAGAD